MLLAAELALFVPGGAIATTIDYITSTVSEAGVDQNPDRDGIQLRYDWTVHNASGGDYSEDALWQYTIETDLEKRGMYAFANSGYTAWNYLNGDNSLFSTEGTTASPIRPGALKAFSALIDESQILGNEQVESYGTSNNGQTNPVDITVPITRNMTNENGVTFGWLNDHNLVSDTNSTASYEAAALTDTDNDGFANWQEYVADTDPNQSNSFFRVDCSATNLSWNSVTGRVYDVYRADALSDTFTSTASFEYPANSFPATPGFYRVKVRMK